MRLAQLARKLSKKPSEITEYLASKDIHIETSSNVKIEDPLVELILEEFGVAKIEEEVEDVEDQAEELSTDNQIESEEISALVEEDASLEVVEGDIEEEDEPVEPVEVIKAPKVELAGLKVVGKIELPEPKKKVVEDPEVKEEEAVEKELEQQQERKPRHPGRGYRDSRDRRPRKNPVVLQREREERNARKKKKEEEKKKKELRTKRYLSKVKPVAEVKPQKKKKRGEERHEGVQLQRNESKGFFGKIVSWLTAH